MVAQSVLFLALVSPATGTTTPAPRQGPLNAVTDFGAVPDGGVIDAKSGMVGGTDNSVQLQKAIDAAQLQGRSLFLPEGRYMVNATLFVGCATPATSCPGCTPTGDAGACVEPNATAGVWGLHPLILAGAGRTLTTIAAQGDLHAILEFNGPPGGGTIGKSTILHDLKDLSFDAGGGNACPHCPCRCSGNPCQDVCPVANISVFARSITRSYFTRVNFYNAPLAGMSLACECAAHLSTLYLSAAVLIGRMTNRVRCSGRRVDQSGA